MKIYKLDTDRENYLIWDYAEDYSDDYVSFRNFKGKPMKDYWKVHRLVVSSLLSKKEKERRKLGDISGIWGSPQLSLKAKQCLHDLIRDYGEFLPLETEVGDYEYFNVTKVIDSFNRNIAKFTYFPDGGEYQILKYSFHKDRINNIPIFKDESKLYDIFISEEFKQRYEECGLTGAIFEEVWDSEKEV